MAAIRLKALIELAVVIAIFGFAGADEQKTGAELAKYMQACIEVYTGR